MTLEEKQNQHIENLQLTLDNTQDLYKAFLGHDISIVRANTTNPFVTIEVSDRGDMADFFNTFPPVQDIKIEHGDNKYYVEVKMYKEVYRQEDKNSVVSTRLEYITEKGIMVWVKFPNEWWEHNTEYDWRPTVLSWAGYGKTTYHSLSTTEANKEILNNIIKS